MFVSIKDRATLDIWNGENTKAARQRLPMELWKNAIRKLTIMKRAATLNDLRRPPNNKLESMKGDRKGQHSIRINDQFRICFVWTDEGPSEVEICDPHKG